MIIKRLGQFGEHQSLPRKRGSFFRANPGSSFKASRQYLTGGERGSQKRINNLIRLLANKQPKQRLNQVIKIILKSLDEETGGVARKFLERLAIFMAPVNPFTVEVCYQSATGKKRMNDGVSLDHLLKVLLASHLLFRLRTSSNDQQPPALTVHPIVRRYVFRKVHLSDSDAMPALTLPGLTTGTVPIYPGPPENVRMVKNLFDDLYNEAVKNSRFGDSKSAKMAIELCRSCFGLIRSRMEANTVPRWTTYEDYIQMGIRVIDLTKKLSTRFWTFAEAKNSNTVEHKKGVLYAEELAWLYNEVGLALCSEGSMQDSYAVWEQGYEINKTIDSETVGGQYLVQSLLHLAHTFIELGNLPVAQEYLEDTDRANQQLGDNDYKGRILGYRGVIAHYRGTFKEADDLYSEGLRTLKVAGGNLRAESFFRYFRGDLRTHWGQFDTALNDIHASRAQAESGRHIDLVANARNAMGQFHRLNGDFSKARIEYEFALREARRIGSWRLEASVLSELSRLAIAQGDYETARQQAMESLRLANELGLGIRQTYSLVTLGLATIKAGRRNLGIAYLTHAKKLAEWQQYWLRGREAEEELEQLGLR